MKHIFIVNASAGRAGVDEQLSAELEQFCTVQEIDYAVWHTASADEAAERIRVSAQNGGERHVYACGGDGTLCGVVNAAAAVPGTTVGLIPIGTGNDFVRNFGGSMHFFSPADQVNGREIQLDLLRCNSRLCVNMINIGFDCAVVQQAARLRHARIIGDKLAYLAGVVITLVRKPGVHLQAATSEQAATAHDLLLIAIANGAFCGGGFRAAPRSTLADGKMDICMVKNISRTQFLRMVGAYHAGTHLELRSADRLIDYRQDCQLTLTFEQTQQICIDGELSEAKHLTIETLPRALRFVLPRGATWREEAISTHEAACVL